MKTALLTGIRKMEVVDIPMPEIVSDHDVLIRMKRTGICGSDIHYFTQGKIGSQVISYPFVIGHEGSGVVAETGKKVENLKVGQAVAIEPAMPCHTCDQCRNGRHHTCRNLKFLGCPGQYPGCLSEYIVIPESSCFPVSDSLSFDDAALAEPLTIGVYAVSRTGNLADTSIGILGYGPIGMSVMLAAQQTGATCFFISDKVGERIKISMLNGAEYAGNPDLVDIESKILQMEKNGLDVVFECCGKQEAVDQAFQLLKPGGKLVLVGIPEFEKWQVPVDISRRHEIDIINIRRQNGKLQYTLDHLASKSFKTENMITHHFPLEQIQEAFHTVEHKLDGVMKAMIDLD